MLLAEEQGPTAHDVMVASEAAAAAQATAFEAPQVSSCCKVCICLGLIKPGEVWGGVRILSYDRLMG